MRFFLNKRHDVHFFQNKKYFRDTFIQEGKKYISKIYYTRRWFEDMKSINQQLKHIKLMRDMI